MYKEPEKVKVRNVIFEKAIKILTADRERSTIADIEYPRRIRDTLTNGMYYNERWATLVSDYTIDSWQKYFKSLLGIKKPSELKVAFLAGPNPENDVEVMLENGILPENIWAFESDNKIYKEAVENLRKIYPKIKLFRYKIGSFFTHTPIRFDIIYLDSCSPIYTNSDGACINTLKELFRKHALCSPGVLITNYSLPSRDGDDKKRKELAFLASLYLYPKKSLISTYLLSLRITRAKQLLRFSDRTVEEIGCEVGIDNPAYFSRVFKEIEGVSPRTYRDSW